MPTNDWDGGLARVLLANNLGNEGLSANNVKSSDTEQFLGVEDICALEDLGGNGDCGIYRIRNDENECLRSVLCSALDETLDNTCIDLEEIVTGHARLAYKVLVHCPVLLNCKWPYVGCPQE